MVKSNRLVSDCVTVSDEAFAILIAKENLNYWIAKAMTKGVQHGNTKHSAVARVCKANSKTDENSDDEVELMRNDSNDNDNVVGNEEDEAAAIDSEKLAKYFYCLCSIIKKLRAEDEGHSWDHDFKDAIVQAVSFNAWSKMSSGGSTISSKSSALDKVFQIS
jgi:hypothetical protein